MQEILWSAGALPRTAMTFVTHKIRADPVVSREMGDADQARKFTLFS